MIQSEGKFEKCCFTGHRNLPYVEIGKICVALDSIIEKLCLQGCNIFISGGALGFDILAAERVVARKQKDPHVQLIMALPCRDQHAKWRVAERERYERVLAYADEVVCMCETYTTGCMHLRNKYMVDNSDICVAYLTNFRGGTAYTVNYAREKNRRVVNLADFCPISEI